MKIGLSVLVSTNQYSAAVKRSISLNHKYLALTVSSSARQWKEKS